MLGMSRQFCSIGFMNNFILNTPFAFFTRKAIFLQGAVHIFPDIEINNKPTIHFIYVCLKIYY